jgi:hypothetical protein
MIAIGPAPENSKTEIQFSGTESGESEHERRKLESAKAEKCRGRIQ